MEECELKVIKALTTSERIQKILVALKTAQCPLDISRHIACEPCPNSALSGHSVEKREIYSHQKNSVKSINLD